MNPVLANFLDILDLEQIEVNIFRGQNRPLGRTRVYGGQVLAQALIAAGRTVDDARKTHSLHAYFILAGDLDVPIVYEVDRLRDGGSFTTRRVAAIQHGRPIFNLSCSFHKDEPGLDHQSEMPDVPGPDKLPTEVELAREIADMIPEAVRNIYTRERPIEFRPVNPVNPFVPDKRKPFSHTWLRAVDEVPGGQIMQQAILAYASDWGLLGASLLPHGRSFFQKGVQAASLDHAIWFHRPFKVNEWLLYSMESPSAFGARGFTQGSIHTQDGELVASVVQEGLIRLID